VRRTRNLFAPPTRASYEWECASLELTHDHLAVRDGSTQLRVLEVYVSLGTTGLALLQVCILNSRIAAVSLVLGADVDLNDSRATSSFELRRDPSASAVTESDGETERLIVEAVAEGALEILRVLAQRGDLAEYASMCKLIGVAPMSYDQLPMHEFLALFLAQEHRHSLEAVSSAFHGDQFASPTDNTTPTRRRQRAQVHHAQTPAAEHTTKDTEKDAERALQAAATSSSDLGLVRLALLSDASGLCHLLAGVGSVQLTRVMAHLRPAQLITVRPTLLSSVSLRVRRTRADLGGRC
jgi:hypothetical protein